MAANGQVEALRKQLDQRAQSEKAIQAEAERLAEQLEQERKELAQVAAAKREAEELHQKQLAALHSDFEASEAAQRVVREVRLSDVASLNCMTHRTRCPSAYKTATP